MFVDNGNGTVSDTDTGLMWKQAHEKGAYTFDEACCLKSDLAGFDDWHLPTIKELLSIVENVHERPTINVDAFPATPSAWFWSSSPYGFPYGAWFVNFLNGNAHYSLRHSNLAVRLVRTPS